jgi:glycosyltransferase involved in cell wall biosynthesis
MIAEKGPHHAIAAAQETGQRLLIAGKLREPWEHSYFEQAVRPHLGSKIEFTGEAGHTEKVRLLRDARAVLFPVDWEEPFGLVPIEAMACGTPVVATRRGAVPETVVHGRTGVIVDSPTQIAEGLSEIEMIDPHECRLHVERHFTVERMVSDYERIFRLALGDTPPQE